MLHEVLLALSGHPSPLFASPDGGEEGAKAYNISEELPILSSSESALLRKIARLSELHRKLRAQTDIIASTHSSTICRAVATSIQQVHLARFQRRILDVESRILTKDASIVGAYEIVPFAGVVGEFDDWYRRMDWYWSVTCFMQDANKGPLECTGAALIDKLRSEIQTGFPDIEEAATELSSVAEIAWLRQLTPWLLYGKVPAYGANDFFIKINEGQSHSTEYLKQNELLPAFTTPATSSSILFIGRSLHQIRLHTRKNNLAGRRTVDEAALATANLKYLVSLSLPIVPSHLQRAVSAIRASLSRNVLQHLLPIDETLLLLQCLRQFFLLKRGEFAIALINEADARLEARQQGMGRLLQSDPMTALRDIGIKDMEVSQTLSQTFKSLTLADLHSDEDDVLDFGRQHVTLSLAKASSRPLSSNSINGAEPQISMVAFNDLLFPTATVLGLSIPSPLDLFLSDREVETYSAIHAYLLVLRRAHLRLSELWLRSGVRRHYPAPPKAGYSNSTAGRENLRVSRERHSKRSVAMRKVWATCSAALFLLSETAAYFEGEIITGSWNQFHGWLVRGNQDTDHDEPDCAETDFRTGVSTLSMSQMSTPKSPGRRKAVHLAESNTQRDPETLASAHRSFLASLTYVLLLTDVAYTKELRSLLGNVDSLIAFIGRLQEVQQRLDIEQDSGVPVGSADHAQDEAEMALELDRARKRVDSDLKSVVNRLRQLDHERIGAARYFDFGVIDVDGFAPWKGGGVDRLLMKLDFGRMTEGEELLGL